MSLYKNQQKKTLCLRYACLCTSSAYFYICINVFPHSFDANRESLRTCVCVCLWSITYNNKKCSSARKSLFTLARLARAQSRKISKSNFKTITHQRYSDDGSDVYAKVLIATITLIYILIMVFHSHARL